MNMSQFKEALDVQIAEKMADKIEDGGGDKNSFGAGYDTGYLDALKEIKELLLF